MKSTLPTGRVLSFFYNALMNKTVSNHVNATRRLSEALGRLTFARPVEWVYNPLQYAWGAHEMYLQKYARPNPRVFFLGMNPGPWGMAQTGVPFGEVEAVKTYLKIDAEIKKPVREHPKRPIDGLACQRSEVSGKRLWGLFSSRYERAEDFFETHFVANYCPLVFMDEGARNVTPDKLSAAESQPLDALCDAYLRHSLGWMLPQFAVGVGAYAEACLNRVCSLDKKLINISVSRILHPSPASPAANRGWAEQATKQLVAAGVW